MFRRRDRDWEREIDQIRATLAETTAQNQANSRDLGYLTTEVTQLGRRVDQLTVKVDQLTDDLGSLVGVVSQLAAGQQQQSQVLDYLLRKEQERQNGQ
jgi:septal ring factor EnvC (AmiA/AmiB activator)